MDSGKQKNRLTLVLSSKILLVKSINKVYTVLFSKAVASYFCHTSILHLIALFREAAKLIHLSLLSFALLFP